MCMQYSPAAGFDPEQLTSYLDGHNRDFDSLTDVNRTLIPFLVCGDVSAYDSDVTYPLQVKYK